MPLLNYDVGHNPNLTNFRGQGAGVAELADAPDLGSGGQPPWRFEPSRRYQIPPVRLPGLAIGTG